jgi:hypothetical protein
MFPTKVVEKIKTHISCSVTFVSENSAVCEIIWKNIVGPGRSQMTILRMRMHAGYLRPQIHIHNMHYLLLFHCNNGYTNTPQSYVVRTVPVCFFLLVRRYAGVVSEYAPQKWRVRIYVFYEFCDGKVRPADEEEWNRFSQTQRRSVVYVARHDINHHMYQRGVACDSAFMIKKYCKGSHRECSPFCTSNTRISNFTLERSVPIILPMCGIFQSEGQEFWLDCLIHDEAHETRDGKTSCKNTHARSHPILTLSQLTYSTNTFP